MIICSPQLGVSPKSILGGEIYDREILNEFAEAGHQIEVILPFRKQYKLHPNLHVTYMPFPFVFPPHLYNIFVLPYLVYLYKKYKFQVLRIHSPTFIGLAAWIFKKIYPNVLIMGVYHWLGEGGRMEKWWDPFLTRMFDLIITDSNYTKQQIESKFLSAQGKTYAVHNGVDRSLKSLKPKPIFPLFRISKDTIVLLFMGLFIERKDPLFLLSIVKALRAKGLDIVLLLCGKGSLESNIRAKIIEQNLHNYVHLVSPVYGAEKNELLNSAHIYVHPAQNEGFSLAVIEAMSVGLPVVIRNAFSAGEAITDGINGFICDTKSDWVKNIGKLCKSKFLRQKMSVANISRVNKEFNWEIAAKKQLQILQNIFKS